jgi:ABC-type transport system involved in multi-copper enzyme maturation permease subunit
VSALLDVLRFELAFRRRHPPLWIFSGVCFAFAFLSMAITDGMTLFGGTGAVAINSPAAITRMMLIYCLLLGLVITTAFVASAVNRDHEYGISSLFFSTPLGKHAYVLGRFFGALLAAFFMISGLAVGALLGSVMPWHEAERVVAPSLVPYLYSLFVLLFPNLLFIGAIAFGVATLTRRMMYSYVALLGLLVVYIVSGNYISDLDNDFVAAISDPFGIRAYSFATRYWTPAELNTIAAPFTTEIVVNRVLWSSLGLLVLLGTTLRYRMELPSGGKPLGVPSPAATERPPLPAALPHVEQRHDLRAALTALWLQTRSEVRAMVRSAPFIVILLFGVGNMVGVAFGSLERGGTTTLPVTHVMLGVIEGGMSAFMLIVLIFYAGELVHRERKHRMHELFDTLPIPSWVPLLAKLAAMIVGLLGLLLTAALTTLTFQLAKGYTHVELGLYVRELVLVQAHVWVVLSVAAIVAQVIANHKFVGYALMVLVFVAQAALPALDFEHNLYNFAASPPVTYSDMNGYGHFVLGIAAYTVYWSAVALVLVMIAELFWVRGTDNPLKLRIAAARARLTRGRSTLIAAAVIVWIASGGYIFYNTNVLNRYLPSDEQEALQARYEHDYKQYEALPHPRITKVEVDAEIHPEERRVELRGTLHLVNKHPVAIEVLHMPSFDPTLEVVALDIPGATLEQLDEALGYRIYRFAQPLAPGAELDVTWHYRQHLRGFTNGAADNSIVANGTFINSGTFMPHFGYSDQLELSEPEDRRKHGLPERLRMPKIDDAAARQNTYISSDSDWVEFAASVSTSADQIAIAPGYLVEERSEGGRRHFRYEMDAPILNFWSILSARYTVARDEWRPKDGGEPVAIEIYHHDVHAYNVDKMIAAIKASLDCFTVEFSPYQHRQVRILEFPQYASFAQSFPNTIPYSESIGFIADASAEEDIDYVFYVTAHEVAHQWWAHQVIGANVQGATLMSESLSQYSALLVMERHYGPHELPKFLEYEMNGYLAARSGETIEELPLLYVENQQYIHYQKASVVFFALREYIGEAALNAALRDYVAEVAFQQPPYTISLELYEHLKRATPDEYQYLLADMFERITLYDNRTRAATVSERDDGKFELTLDLQIDKLYADGKGEETPAEQLADWIEVGAYVEREGEDGKTIETPIYLERHRFDAREQTLTLVLDERPLRAGIDPRHLLIDRRPRDNVRDVE